MFQKMRKTKKKFESSRWLQTPTQKQTQTPTPKQTQKPTPMRTKSRFQCTQTDYLSVTGSQTQKWTAMDSALTTDSQSLTETGSETVIRSATVIDLE